MTAAAHGPRVLVACEFSGRVRDAFRALGCDAVSCDLLPSDAPGAHMQGDVLSLLDGGDFDLMIAHPPCDHLGDCRRDGRAVVALARPRRHGGRVTSTPRRGGRTG
jgi:hypothetical protein